MNLPLQCQKKLLWWWQLYLPYFHCKNCYKATRIHWQNTKPAMQKPASPSWPAEPPNSRKSSADRSSPNWIRSICSQSESNTRTIDIPPKLFIIKQCEILKSQKLSMPTSLLSHPVSKSNKVFWVTNFW